MMQIRTDHLDPSPESATSEQLELLMTRIRAAIRGDATATSLPTATQPTPSTPGSPAQSQPRDSAGALAEVLADQAAFNRMSLEFMQGLLSHIQRLEDDLRRYEAAERRKTKPAAVPTAGSNGHKAPRDTVGPDNGQGWSSR